TLIEFNSQDKWTFKDACEGTQIFGGTGSGKTSGSGQQIAKSFLNNGLGGLVLTVKSDEKELWLKYVKECNREKDIIVISENNGIDNQYFNFLEYELNRVGRGGGLTENLVNLFITVISSGDTFSGTNSYWLSTLKQLLRNTIDLITIATDTISVQDMYKVISTAPQNSEDLQNNDWRKSSTCWRYLEMNNLKSKKLDDDRNFDLDVTRNYWTTEFPNLDDKTRSIIVSMFTSRADCFLRGSLRKIFCNDEASTVTPELTFEGKIIILDLPKKEFEEIGQYAQVLFKYMWQRAVERRIVKDDTLPVFLWVDEAQYFYTEYDSLFQTTARSSRVCSVFITQNIPNYEMVLKGGNSYTKVQAFLGNLQTKIFHANSDIVTNKYASQLIAQTYVNRNNTSQNSSNNQSYSSQRVLEDQVLPKEFAELKNGGEENNNCVEAIVYQTGRKWILNNCKNYSKVEFKQ
ncbi:MAG: TraM recognition domain-containing protein, partial [Patescibacteria group bacterium]